MSKITAKFNERTQEAKWNKTVIFRKSNDTFPTWVESSEARHSGKNGGIKHASGGQGFGTHHADRGQIETHAVYITPPTRCPRNGLRVQYRYNVLPSPTESYRRKTRLNTIITPSSIEIKYLEHAFRQTRYRTTRTYVFR